MRHCIVLVSLALLPGLTVAQGPPGTNIIVDVRVIGLSMRGDTTAVSYVLRNRAGSLEKLFHFTVDAPSPVITISLPQPEDEWDRSVTYRSRSVAEWVALGEHPQPGDESPTLAFTAIGLADIVTHWIRGYYPPPPLTAADTLPAPRPSDPLITNSVPGQTVGVTPFPSDVAVASLVGRMLALTDQVCGVLSWITNASVCASLTANIQQASQAISQGDSSGARTQLQSFVSLLSTQHDTVGTLPVKDNAYWLLKVNAEFILSRLGQSTTPMCFGSVATIYVQNGVIVGGPDNGQAYSGDLDGTSGNDVIVGTAARDIVEAGAGADKVCGLGGDDLIKGQVDADQLDGGDGNDAIEGGGGNDVILGGGGNDLLKGQDGNDTVSGGEGNDTIEGGTGDDDLDGGPGTDTLKGQGGTDACRQGETVETCEMS